MDKIPIFSRIIRTLSTKFKFHIIWEIKTEIIDQVNFNFQLIKSKKETIVKISMIRISIKIWIAVWFRLQLELQIKKLSSAIKAPSVPMEMIRNNRKYYEIIGHFTDIYELFINWEG